MMEGAVEVGDEHISEWTPCNARGSKDVTLGDESLEESSRAALQTSRRFCTIFSLGSITPLRPYNSLRPGPCRATC